MKKFVTWKCDVCDALFEFDVETPPLRCPDCFSPHEHLRPIDDEQFKADGEAEGGE